jgi:hypothetical protein
VFGKVMPKQKKLTDQEVHKLFAKFAAPVFRAAKTPCQQKGAQRLAQTLWQAFLTGPEIETSAFKNLEKFFSLKTEDLAIIKERYYLEMKPSITSEELSLLKAHYNVRKK